MNSSSQSKHLQSPRQTPAYSAADAADKSLPTEAMSLRRGAW